MPSARQTVILRFAFVAIGDGGNHGCEGISVKTCSVAGAVGELVGIDGGVVSGVINLESSGVEASDWRPRHDERYHEA